jgi:hypothetical protein
MRNIALLFLFFFLFYFVFNSKTYPNIGLDSSWSTGLNEIHKYNYQFGKDVIFTFGPYGFFYTNEFHPSTKTLGFFFGLVLSIGFFSTFYFFFRNEHWIITATYLTVLIFTFGLVLHFDSLVYAYLILTGILFIDQHEEIKPFKIFLLSFPLGLLILIKGTLMIGVFFIQILILLFYLNKKFYRRAALFICIPILTMVFFWILANQSIFNLPNYFLQILPIISGYTEAMNSINGSILEPIFYIIISSFFLYQMVNKKKTNIALIVLISGILFLVFKAGFTRHSTHAIIASNTLILVSFLIPNKSNLIKITSIFFAFIFWILVFKNHTNVPLIHSLTGLNFKLKRSIESNFYPDSIEFKYNQKNESIKNMLTLPKLKGTTDLYAYDQSRLFVSENLWSPRPIFQSYSAYLPELAEKNANFLLSEKAPDFIFFEPQTIDGRFPTLDDGASWPILLYNYQPFEWVSPYLILEQRKKSSDVPPKLNLIEETFGSFDQKIKIPEGKVFAKIYIEPTWIGKLVQVLWKPSEIKIKARLNNGHLESWKYIPSMGKTGFLISPVVSNSFDFSMLFSKENYSIPIESFELSTNPSRKFLWNNKIKIQFYQINNPLYPNILELLNLTKPEKINIDDYKIEYSNTCTGNLDIIYDLKSSALLKGEGWMVESVKDKIPADSIFVWVKTSENENFLIPAEKKKRVDVGLHFKTKLLDNSGFSFQSILKDLNRKDEIKIVFIKNKTIYTCDPFFLKL